MSKWKTPHFHLTHMVGRGGTIMREPETITNIEAAYRLVEEIGAHYVEKGCRLKKYFGGVRIYDCRDSSLPDQSFEAHSCDDARCNTAASENEYGVWTKADRQRYLQALKERGLIV